jgi:hypothetical protein
MFSPITLNPFKINNTMKNLIKLYSLLISLILVTNSFAQNGSLPANVNQNEVYCLSMLSNIPAQTYGTKFTLLYQNDSTIKSMQKIVNYSAPIIDSCLKNAVDSISNPGKKLSLSNWKRFWGPGVIAKQSEILPLLNKPDYYVSAASMTIFQNVSTNTFVVAIQATNPNSLYAWNTLDFSVDQTIPWNNTDTSQGVISNGTSIGLNLLTTLNDLNNNNGVQALLKACNSQTNVVVTGHSLGGALSPVLALYLKNKYQSKFNNVYCLSTAGATPGNYSFAKYYNSQMQNNTIRIWNYFDIIPHAWNASIMNTIKSYDSAGSLVGGIYSMAGTSVFYDSSYAPCKTDVTQPIAFTPMPTPVYIDTLVNWAIAKASSTTYTPICNNGSYFMGPSVSQKNSNYYINVVPIGATDWSIINNVISILTGKKIQITDGFFLPEMAAQHVDAYTYQFQMKQIHEYIKAQIDSNPQSLVNNCSKLISFTEGINGLVSKPKSNTSTKIDPVALFRAFIYKKAWNL